MNHSYKIKEPGDILRLSVRLPYLAPPVEAGGYVLLSVGETCCLAAVGEDPQGRWCATSTLVDVDLSDLGWFIDTGMKVEPLR